MGLVVSTRISFEWRLHFFKDFSTGYGAIASRRGTAYQTQIMHTVPFGKPVDQVVLVLPDPPDEIGGHAHVQGPVAPVLPAYKRRAASSAARLRFLG